FGDGRWFGGWGRSVREAAYCPMRNSRRGAGCLLLPVEAAAGSCVPAAASWDRSGFAHAFGGAGGGATLDLLLDTAADIGIHAFPIVERAAQHRLAHAAEQAAGDLIDQRLTLVIVELLAHQYAGLGEIIILGMERIGAAHHL